MDIITKTALRELLQNGKNSGVEFKRDDIDSCEVAKVLVSFLNLEGGILLLGVEDDGAVSGTVRDNLEEWVAELCWAKIDPPVVPHLTWMRSVEREKDILLVRVAPGPNKPYARVHNNRRAYYIRVGSTNREASTEELERLFQASGQIRYGLKPVPGALLDDFDYRRLYDYFIRVQGEAAGNMPDDADDKEWKRRLRNLDFMTAAGGQVVPTIDGMLLFGENPKRFVPQSGIRALCYPGEKPDYAVHADEELVGNLVPLCTAKGAITESGLVEQALDFVNRNTQPTAHLEGGRRVDRSVYPAAVLREIIVNALVHRDYSIAGVNITLTIYSDRLAVQSPGRLPNTVTVEGIREGIRYARNQILVNVMRDYRYVEHRGMGVREKVIPGMREHNRTAPDFIAQENHFTVRLWKEGR